MRAVIDANVYVSAGMSPGSVPARVVGAFLAGRFDVIVSPPLLAEQSGVLRRSRIRERLKWSAEDEVGLLRVLREGTIRVEPRFTLDVVADETDNRLIEAAVAGHADYIVSGDKLRALGEFQAIRIVTPSAFLAVLEAA